MSAVRGPMETEVKLITVLTLSLGLGGCASGSFQTSSLGWSGQSADPRSVAYYMDEPLAPALTGRGLPDQAIGPYCAPSCTFR